MARVSWHWIETAGEKLKEQCGDLLVSTGPSKEYLLDICIQRGAVCLDNAEAQHIGCCCSTIPLGTEKGRKKEMKGRSVHHRSFICQENKSLVFCTVRSLPLSLFLRGFVMVSACFNSLQVEPLASLERLVGIKPTTVAGSK